MISDIHIKNFRSIIDLKIELGRVNVFIGNNGTGKTNILKAIELANAIANYDEICGVYTNITPDFIDEVNVNAYEKFTFCFTIRGEKHKCLYKEATRKRKYISPNPAHIKYTATSFHYYLNKLDEFNFEPDFYIEANNLFNFLSPEDRIAISEYVASLILEWGADITFTEGYFYIKDRFTGKVYENYDMSKGAFFALYYYSRLFDMGIVNRTEPHLFAVDGFADGLHFHLASKLMRDYIEICKQKDKQVLLVANNIGILDGMDLSDDDVRLFTVRRDMDGHTRVRRVEKMGKEATISLSEAFIRGYLGGTPNYI